MLFVGPGLAIRVICAEEPYICKDFPETNNILKIVADFSASVKKVITDLMYLVNTKNKVDGCLYSCFKMKFLKFV